MWISLGIISLVTTALAMGLVRGGESIDQNDGVESDTAFPAFPGLPPV